MSEPDAKKIPYDPPAKSPKDASNYITFGVLLTVVAFLVIGASLDGLREYDYFTETYETSDDATIGLFVGSIVLLIGQIQLAIGVIARSVREQHSCGPPATGLSRQAQAPVCAAPLGPRSTLASAQLSKSRSKGGSNAHSAPCALTNWSTG